VLLGGSSHPQLAQTICNHLGVPPANVLLDKFSVGETRVEIKESVRGKDVYIIQSGAGKVNDHLMELLITISACKTASARQVTAVLPLFPYSRQSDVPYNKTGAAPLSKAFTGFNKPDFPYILDSMPQTPHPDHAPSSGLANGVDYLNKGLSKVQLEDSNSNPNSPQHARQAPYTTEQHHRSDTVDSVKSMTNGSSHAEDSDSKSLKSAKVVQGFQPQPGYKSWVAQAGTLVADLLTCAGADHVITMDLHDAQYQGFFDIPVDNLYGRPLLKKYIQYQIPDFKEAVIVSPDAGGAKRATAIADGLGMSFALIHKVSKILKRMGRAHIS
jgi:ribose-phosphate pyrophosphokinase